jgi:hypothetical protein
LLAWSVRVGPAIGWESHCAVESMIR